MHNTNSVLRPRRDRSASTFETPASSVALFGDCHSRDDYTGCYPFPTFGPVRRFKIHLRRAFRRRPYMKRRIEAAEGRVSYKWRKGSSSTGSAALAALETLLASGSSDLLTNSLEPSPTASAMLRTIPPKRMPKAS